MTNADHEMLCRIDGEYGEVFRWIDAQAVEHGSQPLASLFAALEDQAFEPLVKGVYAEDTMSANLSEPMSSEPPTESDTSSKDLKTCMIKAWLEVVGTQITDLSQQSASNSDARATYQAALARQLQLKRDLLELAKPNPK